MAKKSSLRGTNAAIIVVASFAIVGVFLFVPLDSLIIQTTPEGLEDIQIEVPDADKLGQNSILEGTPELFGESTQDPLEILLDEISKSGIGEGVTERFAIAPKVILLNADQAQTLFETILLVEPVDPRTTVEPPPLLVEPESVVRKFIDTDFATQLNTAGTKHHQWSSWEKTVQGNNPAMSWQFVRQCAGIIEHNDACLRMVAKRDCIDREDFKCPAFTNGFYGFNKVVPLADWTGERPFKVEFDYSVQGKQRNIQYLARVNGQTFTLNPDATGHFEKDVTDFIRTETSQGFKADDFLVVEMGLNPTNNDHIDGIIYFNNVVAEGPSILKREALGVLEQLTLFAGGKILDFGFIQFALDGVTVNPNEKIVLQGFMEIRLDDKTVVTKVLTASGFTDPETNSIPISIEGRPSIAFTLDDEEFTEGFHTFKIIIRDIIVNVGEGERTRTFEYHKTFVVYILEFDFNGDQFVAFDQDSNPISVFKNDSTLKTCGLTVGLDSTEPEVKPPVVQVLDQGFTIIVTRPDAGKFEIDDLEKTNRIYCSIYPNVPRDTDLLFKVNQEFFEVTSPASQKNWDVTCNRQGCTSNFGYSEVFE